MADEALIYHYLDSTGQEFGPFPAATLRNWFSQGLFPVGGELPVRLASWTKHVPLRTCYPDLQQAFVGPPAIADPAEAEAGAASDTYGGAAAPAVPYDQMAMMGGGMPMMGMGGGGGMPMMGMGGGMPMMGMGMGGGMPMMGGMAGGAAGNSMMGGGRMQGRIKSFNAKQGFGFIESPEAHAMFGRDIFLHKAQIGDLKVGVGVTFTVESNKQGMPQARNIVTIDGQIPGPSPADASSGKTQRSGGGKGGRGGNRNKGAAAGAFPPAAMGFSPAAPFAA